MTPSVVGVQIWVNILCSRTLGESRVPLSSDSLTFPFPWLFSFFLHLWTPWILPASLGRQFRGYFLYFSGEESKAWRGGGIDQPEVTQLERPRLLCHFLQRKNSGARWPFYFFKATLPAGTEYIEVQNSTRKGNKTVLRQPCLRGEDWGRF